jgi:hypothetical protein
MNRIGRGVIFPTQRMGSYLNRLIPNRREAMLTISQAMGLVNHAGKPISPPRAVIAVRMRAGPPSVMTASTPG